MIASTKRIAAIATMIALVVLSGCASIDATVAYDGSGSGSADATQGQEILTQMHADSQRGGD
jgi:uncharacterized protein YceK